MNPELLKLKVAEGTILTIDALQFWDGWEFDFPSFILSPVKKYFDNGTSVESAIEELCIDALVDGYIEDEKGINHELEWRGWNWKYLKKVFRLALSGKKYPKRGYKAMRQTVVFYKDDNDELQYEVKP